MQKFIVAAIMSLVFSSSAEAQDPSKCYLAENGFHSAEQNLEDAQKELDEYDIIWKLNEVDWSTGNAYEQCYGNRACLEKLAMEVNSKKDDIEREYQELQNKLSEAILNLEDARDKARYACGGTWGG